MIPDCAPLHGPILGNVPSHKPVGMNITLFAGHSPRPGPHVVSFGVIVPAGTDRDFFNELRDSIRA